MSTTFNDKDRRVIPRWRSFSITRAFGELSPVAYRDFRPEADTDEFRQLQADWATHKGLHFSTDLVGAALVTGRPLDGREAAAYIIGLGESAPLAARTLASNLIETISPQDATSWLTKTDLLQLEPKQLVRDSRQQLHIDPRNAFMWVDLALGYESLGLMDRAKNAMRAALSLAPHDRFVLRSAVRLFIHQKEPDEAYRLLSKNPSTSKDPWLTAAEIAVAAIADKSPKLFNSGLKMVEKGGMNPLHLSELSSAIATLSFASGNDKRGRKFIRTSLQRPTENAVAQASWASRFFGGIELSPFVLGYVPRSFEANALESYHGRHWDGAIAAAAHWLRDQPFSSRPAIMGSFIASTALNDFVKAEKFARAGLVANPSDVLLQNNLAFALASNGKPDEAEGILRRVAAGPIEPRLAFVLLATHGLILFRQGHAEEGRQSYQMVIEEFARRRQKDLAVSAKLHLALEELRVGTPNAMEMAKSAIAEASTITTEPGLDAIRQRAQMAIDIPPGWDASVLPAGSNS